MKRIKQISDCLLARATAFFLIIFIVMFGSSLYEEEKSEGGEKTMVSLSSLSIPQRAEIIDTWIASERNRDIVKRKLIDGLTFEQVAEEFDPSTRWTQKIVADAIKIIQEKAVS